ncbi:MAG: putative addiction module antidote protein [Ilumatobacteraceae bacterium]
MSVKSDKYKPFDVADYLVDLDDVAGYLELAIAESADDPSAVPRALGAIARTQNMSELARRVGMSRDGLYKALSADGNPTWSTILKVTTALGLRFELHTVASAPQPSVTMSNQRSNQRAVTSWTRRLPLDGTVREVPAQRHSLDATAPRVRGAHRSKPEGQRPRR